MTRIMISNVISAFGFVFTLTHINKILTLLVLVTAFLLNIKNLFKPKK